MSLQSRQFIGTPAEAEKLIADIIDGDQKVSSGRGNYMKMMVATTQAELDSPPRSRNVRADRLSDEEVVVHLAALQAVFERFHAIVIRVAENTIPDPDKELIRKRTAFSRSAGSTVRGYIRAGNDIRALAAAKVTKAALATPRKKRKFTVDLMKRRATSLGAELEKLAKTLFTANAETAQEVLGPMIARLAVAAGSTERATRDADKAMEENLPFHGKKGTFYMPLDIAAARNGQRLAA